LHHIKLTNAHGRTLGYTQWGPGVRHEAEPRPIKLCTGTAIHFYSGETLQEAVALAVHMNPAHAIFRNPRAWVFEPEGEVVSDDGTKSGCKAGTTVEEVALPEVTSEQRVEVAIRCALKVYSYEGWVAWAEKWLSGEDRSRKAAVDETWMTAAAAETSVAARAAMRAAWAATGVLEAAHAAWAAAEAAAHSPNTPIAKIAASVYYREEEAAQCTT
jgi:hypothetical protein